ncbi:MAG: helix-turn-helix domain-containing protein [Desmonostoc vinosum HA7617-LM4]|nr:helix-turn-helix domain-containing protein [Desmonostoc vinosum HA7617-LM4]
MIWLLAQGRKTEEVEEITGYSRTWMYALVKRYNELGVEGLGDRRRLNQGTQPLVDNICNRGGTTNTRTCACHNCNLTSH